MNFIKTPDFVDFLFNNKSRIFIQFILFIMKPEEMEKAMMKNMLEKTGKPIDVWIKIVHAKRFNKNSELVHFLKSEYSVGHFYAHLIAKKSTL